MARILDVNKDHFSQLAASDNKLQRSPDHHEGNWKACSCSCPTSFSFPPWCSLSWTPPAIQRVAVTATSQSFLVWGHLKPHFQDQGLMLVGTEVLAPLWYSQSLGCMRYRTLTIWGRQEWAEVNWACSLNSSKQNECLCRLLLCYQKTFLSWSIVSWKKTECCNWTITSNYTFWGERN